MKKNLHTVYFYLLLFSFSQITLYSQLRPEVLPDVSIIEQITPQVQAPKAKKQFQLSSEMLGLVNYGKRAVNPMIRDYRVDQFLNKYYPNFEQFQLRNGDIAYLKFYYDKFLITQKKCIDLAQKHNLNFGTTRKDFFKNTTFPTRKEKRIYWRKFYAKRQELIAKFFKFNKYLMPALSTEVAMIAQKRHFPELTESMNQLVNLDGTPLEVVIYSNYQLSIPKYKGKAIAGVSIISKCENVFTSGSPAVRKAYPGLRGKNKGLSVHIRLFEDGVTLSHELGHLYYLYYKWEEYLAYIQKKGKDYEHGGHGPDDPSGLAAKMTENGVLPFEVSELATKTTYSQSLPAVNK